MAVEKLDWYSRSLPDVFESVGSSENGISDEVARQRLKRDGPNSLPEAKPDSLFVVFAEQFTSPLIWVLFLACITMYIIGEATDSAIILGVLIFNAVIGTIQEGRAQNTLSALKNFTETEATVFRAGKELIIPDYEVVLGDILILEEGEKIPADARIIESRNLTVDESSISGESEPVRKIPEQIGGTGLGFADQKNMLFRGATIAAGQARAVVVATGLATVIGKIAREVAIIDTEIPLKKDIRHLSQVIIVAVFCISLALFIFGVASGRAIEDMFGIVVSLSVSIIPEGLPIVITLVLATGVWRMSKRNALVKKLQAVEALGQASVIALDKTGTITRNEMMVQRVYVNGSFFDVTGNGYEPVGELYSSGTLVKAEESLGIGLAGKIAAFSGNAHVMYSEESRRWLVRGDPTDAALLVFSQKVGYNKSELEKQFPLVSEVPFDYALKYHSTSHAENGKNFLSMVGAPEAVLELSKKIWRDGKHFDLLKQDRLELEKIFSDLSREGLRVVAFAEGAPLAFVGFFGMRDTIRAEVKDSVSIAEQAGIKTVMITGDHRITAEAIGKETGIYKEGSVVLTGQEIDGMTDAKLALSVPGVSVFARVTPEHKLRIIQAYKAHGEVVAMTGDGVNDVPSLVAADLGVAMGKIGTEVAKEASDIVLLDDNFGSVISAVEEGRTIYKTIKKVILYLFSTNLGEVLTIAGALFIGYPLPLLAGQIIWLNLVTDSFLDVALAMEPKEKGLLLGKFQKTGKYLVDSLMVQRMFFMAVPMMIGTLYIFHQYALFGDIDKARTVALTMLAAFQWFNAWNCRSEDKSVFQMNPFSNKPLIAATMLTVSLQILALYTPLLQGILRTVPLSAEEFGTIIAIASTIVLFEEVRKFHYRRSIKGGNGIVKTTLGFLLLVIGIIGLAVPLLPGFVFIFFGLELIGLEIISRERIKEWARRRGFGRGEGL